MVYFFYCIISNYRALPVIGMFLVDFKNTKSWFILRQTLPVLIIFNMANFGFIKITLVSKCEKIKNKWNIFCGAKNCFINGVYDKFE